MAFRSHAGRSHARTLAEASDRRRGRSRMVDRFELHGFDARRGRDPPTREEWT
jgi:hypothetical protein